MHAHQLKGASGKVAGQSVGLSGRTVIGRAADCDLVVDEEAVAPRHAEITRDDKGGLQLRQLDSAFETRVNGKSVDRVSLAGGDEIRIGSCRWVLQAPGLRPQKVLTPAATRRKRLYWPWLFAVVVFVLVALAWQRGWIPFR